jgi:hypothetical protein
MFSVKLNADTDMNERCTIPSLYCENDSVFRGGLPFSIGTAPRIRTAMGNTAFHNPLTNTM